MKPISALGKILAVAVLTTAAARAGVILDVTSALTLADPTQTGRLSRNALPQDWTGIESFPGVINTTTVYEYTTYLVNVGLSPFALITIDSLSANTFVSAYQTAYVPDSAGSPNFGFDTNWLGDAGSSGNLGGTTPLTFGVVVPVNGDLLVVVNNTSPADVGVGDPFHITVETFDTATITPEPTTWLLTAAPLLGIVWWKRRYSFPNAAGFRSSTAER